MNPGEIKSEDAADQCERHVQKDESGALHCLKCLEQKNENQKDTYRDDHNQTAHRSLLILELSAPRYGVSLRQFKILGHHVLHFLNETAHVPAFDEDTDRRGTSSSLAADVHHTFLH